ncbi:MAG: hypothetical protein EB158_08400, partial [Nitrosopumilaceae archaeon]|nr:hypothetical protein [Nitrosopumilaceae archaeon]
MYPLGKLQITNANSTFTESRNWYVAADPAYLSEENGIIAYRDSNSTTSNVGLENPKFRVFVTSLNSSRGMFTSEKSLHPNTGNSPVNFTKVAYSPFGRILLVTQTYDGYLNSYVCDYNCTDTNNWSQQSRIAQVFTTSDTANSNKTKFDVEFETKSGKALLVYDDNATAGRGLAFMTLPNTTNPTWNSTQVINDNTANTGTEQFYTWIRMDPSPTTNSIVVGAINPTSQDLTVFVWNGIRFQSGLSAATDMAYDAVATLNATNLKLPVYDLKWTLNGTRALVVSSITGTNDLNWDTFSGSTWTDQGTLDAQPDTSSNLLPRFVDLYRNPNNGVIQLVLIDQAGDLHTKLYDIQGSGTSPVKWRTTVGNLDTSLDEPYVGTKVGTGSGSSRSAAFAWNATTVPRLSNTAALQNGRLMFDTNDQVKGTTQTRCAANCTATGATTVTAITTGGNWLSLYANPRGGQTLGMIGIRADSQRNVTAFSVVDGGTVPTFVTHSPQNDAIATDALATNEHYSFAWRPITTLGNKTLTYVESLGLSDSISKTTTKALTESLGISDTTSRTTTKALTESLGISDTTSR